MSVNSSYVSTGKPKVQGAIYKAPVGTSLPSTAEESLNPAFACLGFVSEDGMTNSNSPTTTTFKDWNGSTVLEGLEDRPDTYTFKLIEVLNADVQKVVYGDDNVDGDAESGMIVSKKAEQPKDYAWIIDTVLTDGRAKRIVIPKACVTSIGDVVYKANELIGYEITISAKADSNGKYADEIYSALPSI